MAYTSSHGPDPILFSNSSPRDGSPASRSRLIDRRTNITLPPATGNHRHYRSFVQICQPVKWGLFHVVRDSATNWSSFWHSLPRLHNSALQDIGDPWQWLRASMNNKAFCQGRREVCPSKSKFDASLPTQPIQCSPSTP